MRKGNFIKGVYISTILLILLSSCSSGKEESLKNAPENTCIDCNRILWSMTGQVLLPQKKVQFQNDIATIDEEIKKQGNMTFDQLIEKARRYEYIGDVGKAIQLYEENYSRPEHKDSLVYNHNMAKLYESVKRYDLALDKYQILVEEMKHYEYLKDVANLYDMLGNKEKSKKAMDAYDKFMGTGA